MKILTTLHHKDNLEQILQVADGILLGDMRFAKTLTNDFKDHIIDLIQQIHENHREVFILLNRLFTDQELIDVKAYLKTLPLDMIQGFIGADIGLLEVMNELGLTSKFVYNPETLLTNDVDFNDLSNLQIKGAFVSKEITLEDILEIGQLKKYQMFYFGHGHMSMFYSKRQMLQTFKDYQNEPNNLHEAQNLRLSEAKRPNEAYPILEDHAGTHVFRGHIFNSFNALNELIKVVDYFIVDSLFLNDSYASKVIKMYKTGVMDQNLFDTYKQTLHDGFLFDESTIKGEKND